MKLSEWFTDASKWCQGCAARDSKQNQTECFVSKTEGVKVAPNVCSMCLYAALFTLISFDQFESVMKRVRELIGVGTDGAVGTWNDQPGRTFEEVVAVVKQLEET